MFRSDAPWDQQKTEAVLQEVQSERHFQERKWGQQNHDPFAYLSILGEEVGEAHKAALESNTWQQSENPAKFDLVSLGRLREELIQVAAVAVAIVECLDRGKWNNQKEKFDAKK